jgi:branched-chain amino acid transport system ATP-binding protein
VSEPVLELQDVSKSYGGLRPLRIARLALREGERVALVGLDGPAAETLVNLVTGASLPDQGRVALFARDTASINDPEDWLSLLEHLGIVSARAVLLDDLTVAQNIATAYTLSIDPVSGDVMADVRRLAAEVGLDPDWLDRRVAESPVHVRPRCHLAKAMAMNPLLLVLEHANAFAPDDAPALACRVGDIARTRGLAVLVITAEDAFARAAADRVLTVSAATGELKDRSGLRRFLPGA